MNNCKVVVMIRSKLGESPVWDDKRKCIYWVDIIEGKLHIHYIKTQQNEVFNMGLKISALAPCTDGNIIFSADKSIYFFNIDTGQIKKVNSVEKNHLENRFNDGKCDPQGRFWAGTLSPDQTGALYCIENNKINKKLDNISCSNGICWDKNKGKMYYIDTNKGEIWQFNYNRKNANISDKKIIIKNYKGKADGMTIDEEGMIWVAHWGEGKVCRWNPENAKCISQIELPVSNPTSCVFGGEELDELYITSASLGLSEYESPKEPLAGSLFKVKVDVHGLNTDYFKVNNNIF